MLGVHIDSDDYDEWGFFDPDTLALELLSHKNVYRFPNSYNIKDNYDLFVRTLLFHTPTPHLRY